MFGLIKWLGALTVLSLIVVGALVYGNRPANERTDAEVAVTPADFEKAWDSARELAATSGERIEQVRSLLAKVQAFADSPEWQKLRSGADWMNRQNLNESLATLREMKAQMDQVAAEAPAVTDENREQIVAAKALADRLATEIGLRELLSQYQEGYRVEGEEPVLPESAPESDKKRLEELLTALRESTVSEPQPSL